MGEIFQFVKMIRSLGEIGLVGKAFRDISKDTSRDINRTSQLQDSQEMLV